MHEKKPKAELSLAGVLGFFKDPSSLLLATEKVRDSEYSSFDVFTPYPVHGLDHAQGLKRSPIAFFVFAAALTGCVCGFLLQYWTSVVDWPIIVGGKPFNSWPAFVPVVFECTILFAGLMNFHAMLFYSVLPGLFKKSFDTSLTNDRFAILVEPSKKGKPFVESEVSQFLKSLGAQDVRGVHAEGWF